MELVAHTSEINKNKGLSIVKLRYSALLLGTVNMSQGRDGL